MDRKQRIGLLAVTAAFAIGAPGVSLAGQPPAVDQDQFAYRRFEADDDALVLHDDDDNDMDRSRSGSGSGNGGTTTKFGATRTGNRDGDDTRGADGTSRGDGGTRTRNGDRDDTRGNDRTSDGDRTRGEDGTGGGDNSRSRSNYSSRD